MIVVLRHGSTEADIVEVEREVERRGLSAKRISTGDHPALHIVAGPTRRTRGLLRFEQVEGLVPTSGPRIRATGRRFYPYHFMLQSAVCVILLGGLVMMAGFLPPGLGRSIDPGAVPDRILDPWYARAPLEFVALFPRDFAWLGWIVLLGAGSGVLLLPLLDRDGRASAARRVVACACLGVLAVAWVWLTIRGGLP